MTDDLLTKVLADIQWASYCAGRVSFAKCQLHSPELWKRERAEHETQTFTRAISTNLQLAMDRLAGVSLSR